MAAVGCALTVAMFTQKAVIAVSLVGTLLLPFLASLSGNPRLFFLWCMLVATPIEFSKFFKIYRHMGGEYGLRIEALDPFMLLLCIYWIRDRLRRTVRNKIIVTGAGWCWVLLILMAAGTVIAGPFRTLATFEVVRMLKVLVLFLLLANTLNRPELIRHAVMALILGMLLQSLYGLGQYFFHFQLGLARLSESKLVQERLLVGQRSRVGALLGHPNILSCYLAMLLPVAIALLFTKASYKVRVFIVTCILLGQAALIATLSRNGWVAFAAATIMVLALTWLHRGIRIRFLVLRWGVLSMMVILLAATAPKIIERLTESNPTSTSSRMEMVKAAWKMVKDRPILGIGKNAFAYFVPLHPKYWPGKPNVLRDEIYSHPKSVLPVHDIYFQQWVEQGTVGLVIFLLMLFLLGRMAFANLALTDPLLYAINVGASAGLLAVALHGLFDWVFWWNPIMRVFWILAGIVAALNIFLHKQQHRAAA